MTDVANPPKVFISYAWEDDIKTWVLEFATRLRSDGVNAILDQWETVPGDQLTEFMEKSVRESDFVVFVCTPTYKRKSDRRKGGVGYEGSIITGEVFAKNNHRKFIPVLRKGKWVSAAPSWATSKLFIDLRNDPYNEMYYQQLLNTLFRQSPTAPPVWDDILRETAKREAAEKAVREKTEKENAEKERLKAEEQTKQAVAKEKAEREAAEKVTQEKGKRQAIEKAKREKAERRAAQIRWVKEAFFNSFISFKLAVSKTKPFLRIGSVIVLIIGLFWFMGYISNFFPTPTPESSLTTIHTALKTPQSTDTSYLTEIIDAKGVPMRLVSGGDFRMGGNDYLDEKPLHLVYVETFYIDKYEVTNSLYKACVGDEACPAPHITRYYELPSYRNHPVVFVDWTMANAYCQWRRSHLPTEAEWEKAARWDQENGESLVYPWGNEIDETRANYDNNIGTTSIFTLFSNGISPFGVYNMAGNVMEWVDDWYKPYPGGDPSASPSFGETLRVVRGGAWNLSDIYIRSADRMRRDPDSYSNNLGFRCAQDVVP